MIEKADLLSNVILLAQLRNHRAAKMPDLSAEFVNAINKIKIEVLNDEQVQIQYNFYDQNIVEIITSNSTYEFLDELLQRNDQVQITSREGVLIDPNVWRHQLKPSLLKIHEEKNYDHYLKHLKLELDRFGLEYFDDIVVLKDKENRLLTNVLRLRNALQQCM